jgi:peptidoglycan/LPS O-acetylase OafA/YrhL
MNIYPGGGSMAVTFFFVLGGFAMTLGYKDKITNDEFNYRQYLTRRCIKFFPLHWLCILAVMPLALLSFTWLDVPKLALNAALLQTWVPIQKWYFSFNWVSWYLANTMFFAVVFPFVFRSIAGASSKGKGLIAAVMAIIYVVVTVSIPEEKYHAILYISPYMRLMDFVFGIFLALGYLKLKERQSFKWNSVVNQVVVFSLIAILFFESYLLSKTARLIAPVYWIPVALLILIASLSDRIWGGKICYKTNIYYALAN